MSVSFTDNEICGFWKYIDKTASCWVWTGRTNNCGYGMFYNNGIKYVHRISWEIHNGEIPEDKEINHICRNRVCVNPKHLELLTHQENLQFRDMSGKNGDYFMGGSTNFLKLRKECCNKGHEIKYLKVIGEKKVKCVECLKDTEKMNFRQNITSYNDITELINIIEQKYSKTTITTALKHMLLTRGVNPYSRTVTVCRRTLERYIISSDYEIEDLMNHYKIKHNNYKVRV